MSVTAAASDFRCAYIKRSGSQCRKERVDPDDVDNPFCEFHVTVASWPGAVPRHVREQLKPNPNSVSPIQALMDEVTRCQLMIKWLESLMADRGERALFHRKITERTDSEQFGVTETVRVLEELSPLVQLYRQERSHLVVVCRQAVACNIDMRQIEINEQLAETVILAMQKFAALAGFDPLDIRVRGWLVQAMEEAHEQQRAGATAIGSG